MTSTLEYILPLKWGAESDSRHARSELGDYLKSIAADADITVVDGSPEPAFAEHADQWSAYARVIRPEASAARNRKVTGVTTGMRHARHEYVVIADDDVRYRPDQLADMAARLRTADLVRPQNVFVAAAGQRLPWHARWDTARILINRAFGSDYPGTFGLRRSTFLAMGGYDGDVLFENLQLMRTVAASGGRLHYAPDLAVSRVPPSTRQFLGQRVRQAYDDFGQPLRLVIEASWLPVAVVAAAVQPQWLLIGAAAAIGVAEYGRRRHAGAAKFPGSSALWAPAWVLERSVCIWIAIIARGRGGVRYHGQRLRDATRPARLRSPLNGIVFD